MTEVTVVTIKSAGWSVPTAHTKPAERGAEGTQLGGESSEKRCGLFPQVAQFRQPAPWAQALLPNSPGKIRALVKERKRARPRTPEQGRSWDEGVGEERAVGETELWNVCEREREIKLFL